MRNADMNEKGEAIVPMLMSRCYSEKGENIYM